MQPRDFIVSNRNFSHITAAVTCLLQVNSMELKILQEGLEEQQLAW
jgi:hypothetical protein